MSLRDEAFVWSPKCEARRLLVSWPSSGTAVVLAFFIFPPYYYIEALIERFSKAFDVKTSVELSISVSFFKSRVQSILLGMVY